MNTIGPLKPYSSGKVSKNTFYAQDDAESDDSDAQSEELLKRKRAWAELEREQDEVKRNIKSILKTAPESRVMDDPILADRVRYSPQKYDTDERVKPDKKTSQLKEELKREERKPAAAIDKEANASMSQSSTSMHQKRQWTTDSAT